MGTEHVRLERNSLQEFCAQIFQQLGVSAEDAQIVADVLVTADAMGIPSHGVIRTRRYVNGLTTGLMLPDASVETLVDTPSSLVMDAHGSMGAPVSAKAMQRIVQKAKTNGAAFGCVRDSNHFGIAGYYAQMALKEDMIGIAMTNTGTLGVPTFGRQTMFGTNPIAFAAPADQKTAFVLDMSTTVVTRGKLELYDRMGKELPPGWAVDKTGRSAKDAAPVLADMLSHVGGGILPLGGIGKEHGGHKGYGLAVMVDILCAVLCGAPSGKDVFDTETSYARVSHFFGAIKISCFRDPKAFRRDMDQMLSDLNACPPAEGEERVYFAGQPELETYAESQRHGIHVLKKTYDDLGKLGEEYHLEAPKILHTA
ncbi:Ldh family oxidoreductase [candidate division KSB3 bacterium]|uniref:Ldh family oxidoreductase n=1 Tax=candidate division KSB3 bacterium TaxID=2044937 RepID=A0A9D5JSE7_9BACT|nr:Ldh family oxidoreductase [candidate division KSB3 bacterium]MBD3323402.1 Ldh family oxidoreductase [candidate division KSB3 bacterium]